MELSSTQIEKTLLIVKPNAVSKNVVGAILARLESHFKISAVRMTILSRAEAEIFYQEHRERPFFESLVQFMSGKPIVAVCLEAENAIQKCREVVGATDPQKAAVGTIRKDFGDSLEANAVHASDGAAAAIREISFFFRSTECFARS